MTADCEDEQGGVNCMEPHAAWLGVSGIATERDAGIAATKCLRTQV